MAIVLGVVGAAIGAFVGGPAGAEVGFMLGEALGAMIFKPHGPQAADLKVQGSAYGRPIPILCGGAYRIAGNVIWAGPPHEHDIGDKKGPSQTGVSLSFACGLCEGPIIGVSRVWLDNKLVYDITNVWDTNRMRSSYTFGKKMTVYKGDETQMPDWLMESYEGAGNVPAHRGMAYVVFNELDLTDYGNVMPSVSFEVVKSGVNVPQVKTVTNPAIDVGAPFHYLPLTNEYWVMDDMTSTPQQVYTSYDANYMGYKKSIQVPLYNDNQNQFWSGSYYDPANQWVFAGINITGGIYGWTGEDRLYLFDPNGNVLVDVRSPLQGTGAVPVLTSNVSGEMWLMTWFSGTGATMYRVNQVNGALMGTYPTTRAFLLPGGNTKFGYNGAATVLFCNPDGVSHTDFVSFDLLSGNWYDAGALVGSYSGLSIAETVYDSKRHCMWGLGKNTTTNTWQWLKIDMSIYTITNYTPSWTLPAGSKTPLYDAQNDLLWCSYPSADGSTALLALNPDTGAAVYQFNSTTTPSVIGYGYVTDSLVIDPVAGAWIAYIDCPGTPTQQYGTNFEIRQINFLGMVSPTHTTLDQVVAFICNRAGLSSGQYDVTDLAGQIVYGYCITNHSSMRDNLTPLMQTYFFDCDDGGLLTFVMRGKNPLVTIPFDDIGAANGMLPMSDPITEALQQEAELPRRLNLTYSGHGTDYQPATQFGQRRVTYSNLEKDVNMTIVLDDNDALGRAMTMLWEDWVQSHTFDFVTSLKYLKYDAADVVVITGRDGTQYPVKLVKQSFDGRGLVKWSAVRADPNIYPNSNFTTQGGTSAGHTPQTLPYSGPTNLQILDVPPLHDSDTTIGVYLAASGYESGWNGAAVQISNPNSSATQVAKIYNASVMGTITAPGVGFYYTGPNIPDESLELTLKVTSGNPNLLASVSQYDFLRGVNAAKIGNTELIYFRDVTQIDATTFKLTGILRARKGTRPGFGGAGDHQFVFLDATKIVPVVLAQTDIGTALNFQASLLGTNSGNPDTPISFTPSNGRVKPLKPHNLTATLGSASAQTDFTVRWFRCARINEGWFNLTDVPLDEAVEAYTVDVNVNGVQKRQLTVTGPFTGTTQPNWVYTTAMQTTDGVNPGDTIRFIVAQNSDQGILGDSDWVEVTK